MARYPGKMDLLGMLGAIKIMVSCNGQSTRQDAYEALRKHFGESLSDSDLSRKLDSLKRRGYIRIYNDDSRCSIEFTQKARCKMAENDCADCHPDGDFRLISFDVPEDKSYGRNMFRKKIKAAGAVQLQKSLWVCDHNISEVVELAAIEYGIDEYVVYAVIKKSNIEQTLKEIFKK